MQDVSGKPEQSFAAYLAKALAAKKGYRPGTVPEAEELFEHCSEVLTRADGLTFAIVAIVDRDAEPERRFGLTKEALERIATDCLRYTGSAGGRKLPAYIMVIDIGAVPLPAAEQDRLALLKSRSPFAKAQISAFAPSVATGQVWTNTPLRGRAMRSFLQGLLDRPRLTEAQLMPEPPAVMPVHRPFLLTYILLGALLAVFAGEYIFRVSPENGMLDPSIRTLIALGALDKPLVIEGGEWWRLFSAPLLHGGPVHLLLNGVALFFAGAVLENVIGRAWFAAVFVVSGITGAVLSLLINPASIISVGASGAIMGLFAAAFAVAYRYPEGSPMRTFLISGSLRVLIPSMLPLFNGLFGAQIDYAAHLGGAIGGVAIGAGLVLAWRREEELPPYRKLAWAIAGAGICAVIYSGTQIASGYAQYDMEAYLIPAPELPKGIPAAKAKSAELVASFPRDPRAHMYRALALLDAKDLPGAEREWRAALAEGKMLSLFFKPQLEEFIRANLASALKDNRKEAEAIETAKPVCATKGEIRDELANQGLCP
jgi:rhomboid protease GluP